MATIHRFNNQDIFLPGAYSVIKSGIQNPAVALAYGNLLVVDTGSGAGWGGLSGIAGEQQNGKNAVYTFNNFEAFRNFAKGGIWYDLARLLFRPWKLGTPGISSITYVRAASTTKATATMAFGLAGATGSLAVATLDEGLTANGTLVGGEIKKGFGIKLAAGTNDTAKYTVTFYRGTFKGVDENGVPYDQSEADSKADVVAKSPELGTLAELNGWMQNNAALHKYFTFAVTGTGAIVAADLTANANVIPTSGATETYSTANVDSALAAVDGQGYDFILADKWGADAQHSYNLKLAFHISTQKVKPDLYIAASANAASFVAAGGAIETAPFYDSDSVTVIHGATRDPKRVGGFVTRNVMYKAAAILGREAGLAPQVPLTFKKVAIGAEEHNPTVDEIKHALQKGVLMTVNKDGFSEIVKGINSLQKNDYLVNEDGTSHSKQIKRITRQLNKEIIFNVEENLLKREDGPNRATVSPLDVRNYIDQLLRDRTARVDLGKDNLILRHMNVNVTVTADAYHVSYDFVPNFEVNFIFSTGFIIDPQQ